MKVGMLKIYEIISGVDKGDDGRILSFPFSIILLESGVIQGSWIVKGSCNSMHTANSNHRIQYQTNIKFAVKLTDFQKEFVHVLKEDQDSKND